MTGKYIKRKIKKARKWIVERPYYIRRAWNRKIIKNRDFTIISNNCWAGRCYQYLGMPYLSPTVGLYFFANDYLKFVADLKYYLELDLEFISPEQSKYVKILKDKGQLQVPIGKLDDIEIIFLHYASEEEALQKWERRKRRINYKNVIIKFSNMNMCTEDNMVQFNNYEFENKFMLNNRKKPIYEYEVYWKGQNDGKSILNDTQPFPGNLNLKKLLDKSAQEYPEYGLSKRRVNHEYCR